MVSMTNCLNGSISGCRRVMCRQHSSVRTTAKPVGSETLCCILLRLYPRRASQTHLNTTLIQTTYEFKPAAMGKSPLQGPLDGFSLFVRDPVKLR